MVNFARLCVAVLGTLAMMDSYTIAIDSTDIVAVSQVGDPPPGLNGDLGRLLRLPGWTEVSGSGVVAFGAETWRGDTDLSGQVLLGWDPQFLYVAARVRDSMVSQPFSGESMWKGDHIILVLDVPRQEVSPEKGRIFQIGLSPGSLTPDGTTPEVFAWAPETGPVEGARIGVQRTEDGYQIEAGIPWASLGVKDVDRGMRIGYDISISDNDQVGEPSQEKLTSLVPGNWELRNPTRLVEGILASGNGEIDPAWIKPAFESLQENIHVGGQQAVPVRGDAAKGKPIQELVVRARIAADSVAGGNGYMGVKLNGTVLDIDRVRNRLPFIQMGARDTASTGGAGTTWFVFYSPDFAPIPPHSPYAVQGIDPFEFRFDVSDLWQPNGENIIELSSTATNDDMLIVNLGVSEKLSRKLEPPQLAPAPTGEIPTFVPVTDAAPDFKYQQLTGGGIEVTLGNQRWVIDSAFSTLTPAWARFGEKPANPSEWKSIKVSGDELHATSANFEIARVITRHDDRLQVIDRITNTSSEDLPVMYTHQATFDRTDATVFLAGLPVSQEKSLSHTAEHPISLVLWKNSGLALIGEDDITRVQSHFFVDGDKLGIQNNKLVVGKGKTIELEYAIYPLETGDRFDFINRVRRNWNVNFRVDGSHVDTHADSPGMNLEMTDAQLKSHLELKNALYGIAWVSLFNFDFYPKEQHPIAVRRLEMLNRLKELKPDFIRLMYYHCFSGFQDPYLQTDENVARQQERFSQDKIMLANGKHADYSSPKMPLFLPLDDNAWGKASESLIDFRMKESGFEGVFWDELAYSSVKFDYNPDHWDGVSADIDPTTHRIARKITSVTLATQAWRLRLAKKFMANGTLMGNGAPHTRTFTQLHFPRFTETASISNLVLMQLYTPIQLGDHLTERNEVDCYRNMVRGLNYGGVYYWYRPEIVPTHQTLTSYMFPITPINLGYGFIIGEERILTNRSGLFGWDDNSQFETVVFDDRGNQITSIDIPRVEKDGKAYAEVRIPEGYSVAIIRK